MTSTEFHTPRARAIVNAAQIFAISMDELIDTLQEKLGDAAIIPAISPADCLWAIASPLFSSDDDFDDCIHEICHILGALLPCEYCGNECGYSACCSCFD